MREKLDSVRVKSDIDITVQQKILRLSAIFLLGVVLGFLAKYLDNVPIIGEIGTYLGFWVFTATLIAAWSRSPKAAASHVFAFFVAMLIAYYLYSMRLFGFFPKYYFIAWGAIALVSPICAYIAWYARGVGWIAGFCASLPIALLLLEGYSFFYTLSIPNGFDVFAAVLLFMVLTDEGKQRLRILLCTSIVFLVFWRLDIISLLFGGL